MRIDWLPDNRPEACERIAVHSYHVMRQMESATSSRDLAQIFDAYMVFARDNRVCHQVIEHMKDVRRRTVAEIERSKTRTVSDVSKRMTGEQE